MFADWVKPYDVRLTPAPVPSAGVFDSPRVQLCINSEWAGHIDGLLERLLWRDAWRGTEAEIDNAIAQVEQLFQVLAQISDCGEGSLQLISVTLTPPLSSSPILLGTFPAGATALSARLAVDQAFDGDVAFSIGVPGNTALLMSQGENAPHAANIYATEPTYQFISEQAVYLYTAHDSVTQGAARAVIVVQE